MCREWRAVIGDYWFSYPFDPIPTTFAASPAGSDGFHWSLYATLTPGTPVPMISFNPSNPSVPANAPGETVVAQIRVTVSLAKRYPTEDLR
jgi:hypothetical protein